MLTKKIFIIIIIIIMIILAAETSSDDISVVGNMKCVDTLVVVLPTSPVPAIVHIVMVNLTVCMYLPICLYLYHYHNHRDLPSSAYYSTRVFYLPVPTRVFGMRWTVEPSARSSRLICTIVIRFVNLKIFEFSHFLTLSGF